MTDIILAQSPFYEQLSDLKCSFFLCRVLDARLIALCLGYGLAIDRISKLLKDFLLFFLISAPPLVERLNHNCKINGVKVGLKASVSPVETKTIPRTSPG